MESHIGHTPSAVSCLAGSAARTSRQPRRDARRARSLRPTAPSALSGSAGAWTHLNRAIGRVTMPNFRAALCYLLLSNVFGNARLKRRWT
jgi:hypothetical protein